MGLTKRLPQQLSHRVPNLILADSFYYTVVFDLDETLVFTRRGPLFARPFLDKLFKLLNGKAEVVVWTAGLRGYAQAVIREIDPEGVVQHCVYRHHQWHAPEGEGQRKNLAALGRDLGRVLLVENSLDAVRGDEANAIIVKDYEADSQEADRTIPALTHLIERLLSSGLSVPHFLEATEMVQREGVVWVLDPAKVPLDPADADESVPSSSRQLLEFESGLGLDVYSTEGSDGSSDEAAGEEQPAAAEEGAQEEKSRWRDELGRYVHIRGNILQWGFGKRRVLVGPLAFKYEGMTVKGQMSEDGKTIQWDSSGPWWGKRWCKVSERAAPAAAAAGNPPKRQRTE
eukprot:Hpha_TRINITY_DN15324_c0_g1::TRINITY_DN15324_c0_g1_i17::g.90382::m.90382